MAGDITPKENPIKISKRPEVQGRVNVQVSKIQTHHPEVSPEVAIEQARDKVASEIVREKLRKELAGARQKMAKDFLTKLGAKFLFDATLDREIATVERDRRSSPLELTLMDIDDFGVFNKRYGIPTGDEVLRTVGETINETLRASDLAFRIGGEELAIVSRRTHNPEKSGDKLISERHHEAIGNAQSENGHRVTVSVGQTDYIRDEKRDTFEGRANTALQVAKKLGKDRVIMGEVIDGKEVYTDTSTGKRYYALKTPDGEFLDVDEITTNG
jgi:diguanylate cyclase (GGDEF)-like protein